MDVKLNTDDWSSLVGQCLTLASPPQKSHVFQIEGCSHHVVQMRLDELRCLCVFSTRYALCRIFNDFLFDPNQWPSLPLKRKNNLICHILRPTEFRSPLPSGRDRITGKCDHYGREDPNSLHGLFSSLLRVSSKDASLQATAEVLAFLISGWLTHLTPVRPKSVFRRTNTQTPCGRCY